MATLLYTLPGDIAARLVHAGLSGYVTAANNSAAAWPTHYANLQANPYSADNRNNAGISLFNKAFMAVNNSGDVAGAIAALLNYTTVITPAIFVENPAGDAPATPEWGGLGPALAMDTLWDSMSAGEQSTLQTWAGSCVDLWEDQSLDDQDFALLGPAARRYGNWTGLFVGSFAALIKASRITRTSFKSAADTALNDYLVQGFDATNGDTKEAIIHYPPFGLAVALWYGFAELWQTTDWDAYNDYLKWVAYPSSPTHGFKFPALGDTTTTEVGNSDFAWRYGGDMANMFKLTPSENTIRAVAALLWAPTSATPATPSVDATIYSKLFSKSGQVIMRERQDNENDLYVLCHVGGEPGPGHDHADRGQVLITKGRPWFIDPGSTFNSNSPKYGTDHGQVLIDGVGQGFAPHIGTIALDVNGAVYSRAGMDLEKAYDYQTAGANTSGYTLDADGLWSKAHNPVSKAIRKVAVVKALKPFICIHDDIKAQDAASHTYESQFPLSAGVQFSSDGLYQKLGVAASGISGVKAIRPGTSTNADLNLTAGQLKAIGQYDGQAPTNYRFNITYSNGATQTVAPYAGEHYGLGAHPALDQAIANVTKLVPVGRPVALVSTAVATPSGWAEVTLPLRYYVRLFNCGSGTIGSEVATLGGVPTSKLTITQTGTDPVFRLIAIPLTDFGIDPGTTVSVVQTGANETTVTIDAETFVVTWGGAGGIVVTTGAAPAAASTLQKGRMKKKFA